MDRRQIASKNASSDSLNIHSTGAGIRKSGSRSRRRTSPRWSEEAVRGSCTPGIPIPTTATTLTQESFNAWMEAQITTNDTLANALPHTPDEAAAVDEWLGILPCEDESAGIASSSRPWSSYPVSTDMSPITAPDYTYSPSPAAFPGVPALMPAASGYLPLLFPSTNPSVTSFHPTANVTDFAFSNPDRHFQQDLLGVGSCHTQISSTVAQRSRTPLRYKPLSTWFHLWLI